MARLADIAGLSIGHWSDLPGRTGCTVVLCPQGASAGVDVRGGGPATHETDLLQPGRLVEHVQAILLTGGSAFGLAAAQGVMHWLEERGYGFQTRVAHVPIVPAAAIYDLELGDPRARPDAAAGYAACEAASLEWAEGQVGAGTGASIGHLLGVQRASPGGLASAALQLADGTVVGALMVVNPFGHVVEPDTGAIIAGPRAEQGGFVDSVSVLLQGLPRPASALRSSTCIGVVVTNAALDRAACTRVAVLAHDGLARCVRPVHTQYDGDTLFVLALPRPEAGPADTTLIGVAAAEAVAAAVVRAARLASSSGPPGADAADSRRDARSRRGVG